MNMYIYGLCERAKTSALTTTSSASNQYEKQPQIEKPEETIITSVHRIWKKEIIIMKQAAKQKKQ